MKGDIGLQKPNHVSLYKAESAEKPTYVNKCVD